MELSGSIGKLGIGFAQLSECLTNDLELALDSGAKHLIRQPVVETLPETSSENPPLCDARVS